MLKNPNLTLLDQATATLDTKSEKLIQETQVHVSFLFFEGNVSIIIEVIFEFKKGEPKMEYRMETIDFDIKIIGKGTVVQTAESFKTISTIWENAEKDGYLQQLIDLSWKERKCTLEGILGVCGNEAAIKEDEFTYFMGVRSDGEVPSELGIIHISHNLWAVFPNVSNAWERLYSDWLPNSGYELAKIPCIECYYPPNHEPSNELWVPVIVK